MRHEARSVTRLSISALGRQGEGSVEQGHGSHRKCNILINFTHYKEAGRGGRARGNLCKLKANNLAKCRHCAYFFLYTSLFLCSLRGEWEACQLLAAAHKLQFSLLLFFLASIVSHISSTLRFLWVVIFICHICMYIVRASRAPPRRSCFIWINYSLGEGEWGVTATFNWNTFCSNNNCLFVVLVVVVLWQHNLPSRNCQSDKKL